LFLLLKPSAFCFNKLLGRYFEQLILDSLCFLLLSKADCLLDLNMNESSISKLYIESSLELLRPISTSPMVLLNLLRA